MLAMLYDRAMHGSYTPYIPSRTVFQGRCNGIHIRGGDETNSTILRAVCLGDDKKKYLTDLNLNRCLSTRNGTLYYGLELVRSQPRRQHTKANFLEDDLLIVDVETPHSTTPAPTAPSSTPRAERIATSCLYAAVSTSIQAVSNQLKFTLGSTVSFTSPASPAPLTDFVGLVPADIVPYGLAVKPDAEGKLVCGKVNGTRHLAYDEA